MIRELNVDEIIETSGGADELLPGGYGNNFLAKPAIPYYRPIGNVAYSNPMVF